VCGVVVLVVWRVWGGYAAAAASRATPDPDLASCRLVCLALSCPALHCRPVRVFPFRVPGASATQRGRVGCFGRRAYLYFETYLFLEHYSE
jgi:hypothetical protein